MISHTCAAGPRRSLSSLSGQSGHQHHRSTSLTFSGRSRQTRKLTCSLFRLTSLNTVARSIQVHRMFRSVFGLPLTRPYFNLMCTGYLSKRRPMYVPYYYKVTVVVQADVQTMIFTSISCVRDGNVRRKIVISSSTVSCGKVQTIL